MGRALGMVHNKKLTVEPLGSKLLRLDTWSCTRVKQSSFHSRGLHLERLELANVPQVWDLVTHQPLACICEGLAFALFWCPVNEGKR